MSHARMIFCLTAILSVGCVTNSKVITNPAGMNVLVNGKDFGKSPCDIQSTGTTFGQYHLMLKDPAGGVLFEQDLPKNVRIWGIFWPPYGVFYNMFEFYPKYTIDQLKLATGQTAWTLKTQ